MQGRQGPDGAERMGQPGSGHGSGRAAGRLGMVGALVEQHGAARRSSCDVSRAMHRHTQQPALQLHTPSSEGCEEYLGIPLKGPFSLILTADPGDFSGVSGGVCLCLSIL